jgi:CxxC-x17-CxxC domain-containing protein
MEKQITIFAETTFRNQSRKFGIKVDDRRRHMYLIGKTGMGKSTILENMIIEDIRSGKGVAVVDPHGDMAEKIIEYIPADRVKDIIYFNPSDYDFPIAFNVVEQVEPHLRHLVASGLIGVFQKLWADSWGPRLEYILRNAILAVLDYPGSTLLAVTRMLSDKAFRKRVIEKIQDPVVKAFWVNEFAGYADKFASEAVSPIQNKVGQFLSSSLIRNIVGQSNSTIDIRKIMDEGKVLIMNLSKGRIGEDNSELLGAMMITKIQLAAMSRVDIPESERKDFYLYVDEFQNFATGSFANILSEARKYRLNLIMAHQYIEQLDEKVREAVFGNVGTLGVFRVGAGDAEVLVREFAPVFTEEDIVNLPKYEFYLKLMIDGIASDPFSARGLLPMSQEDKTGNTERVIKYSRDAYARNKVDVEQEIATWSASDGSLADAKPVTPVAANIMPAPKQETAPVRKESPLPPATKEIRQQIAPVVTTSPEATVQKKEASPFTVVGESREASGIREVRETPKKPNIAAPKSARVAEVYKFKANCHRCSKETGISFQPDGIRPIFCKECLSLVKQEKKSEAENRAKVKKEELKKIGDSISFPKIHKEESPARNKHITTTSEGVISLTSLGNVAPVDFRGKEIAQTSTKEAATVKDEPLPLKEGEEVDLL